MVDCRLQEDMSLRRWTGLHAGEAYQGFSLSDKYAITPAIDVLLLLLHD